MECRGILLAVELDGCIIVKSDQPVNTCESELVAIDSVLHRRPCDENSSGVNSL